MNEGKRFVTDLQGVRYALGRQLGRGGQGAVFEVEGGRLAAKLLFDASPGRRERLLNQIAYVKRLPLEGVDIARPRAVLRDPDLGYVMDLLTGMAPLEILASPPRGVASVARWYLEGGGLKRRLRILAHAAEVLAQIHGKGLAYGDLSPQNVFVSEAAGADEVRLIDADNLQYHSSPAAPAVYTPGYGAPEVVLGQSGVNTLTDAHAFAVAAFRVLTLVHPLLGDTVVNGEPEREEEALTGKFPYVDHPEDASNRSSSGIPRSYVLSRRLADTCRRAFVDGLSNAIKRPGVAEWAERLHTAADATLRCPGCGGTYFHNEPACPFCDEPRPTFAAAIVNLWDPSLERGRELVAKPDGKSVVVGLASLTAQDPLLVTDRLARGTDGRASRTARIEARLRGRSVVLRSLDDAVYPLVSAAGDTVAEVGGRPVEIGLERRAPLFLHFGRLNTLHRVLRFELRPGGGV